MAHPKTYGVLPINYQYFLTSLIYRFINNSSEDYLHFLHVTGYKPGESKKGFKLFTYSMLKGKIEMLAMLKPFLRFVIMTATLATKSMIELKEMLAGVFIQLNSDEVLAPWNKAQKYTLD